MKHVVLLGDSILDNADHIMGGPDIATQLHRLMSPADYITLLARDGAMTIDIEGQLRNLPDDATHLMLAVGGNDALMYSDFLTEGADSVAEVVLKLRAMCDAFAFAHGEVLKLLLKTELPLAICTIYDCNYPDPQIMQMVATTLALCNESIVRNAVEFGLPVIDLRLVCTEFDDYVGEIDPSVQGGEKIARALWRVIDQHNWENKLTTIYT